MNKPHRTLINYKNQLALIHSKLKHTQKHPISRKPPNSKPPHNKRYTHFRTQKHPQRHNKTHPLPENITSFKTLPHQNHR